MSAKNRYYCTFGTFLPSAAIDTRTNSRSVEFSSKNPNHTGVLLLFESGFNRDRIRQRAFFAKHNKARPRLTYRSE